ncbi:AAA family ATPase [Streptomyces muensis]|uniref:AAA family ATPase n=1 Tax=Streptomyces muensis TaxID=1077944 RepID=A0A9X1PWE1_STRM4|nr:AAA family ATPase [Streptomyces muensis]MCF1592551.1 AAA family ATPase [Streptomyces muensis]
MFAAPGLFIRSGGEESVGRPERPVDPEAGPVQRLAHDLRRLRQSAGNPPYRTMARTAGFTASSLSTAAGGERLPSLAVLLGFVRACGGDPAEWESRWKALQAEAEQARVDDEGDALGPYRGLMRFEPDHAQLFFGRERLIEEVRELVCAHRFAALFGASGSGKSSLLRAGLIPCLREEVARRGGPAVVRILTPGPRPAVTYGHLMTPAEDEPESWVVVDQFEEIFTLCRDRAERARFIDMLLAAREPDSRLRVLIAVRADFYAQCTQHRALADVLGRSGLPVGPMNADELREAVVKPAQAVGLLVERELTARIVNEVLDQPGALPMLSHSLLETWRRRKGRILTLTAYEAAGGVHGAIASTAEETYGQLTAAQSRTARQLLLRLIEPGQGNADTRRPLTRPELDEWADPEVPPVLDRLARARLLTLDEEGVQLAHEALISCWPRLRGWIDEDRERLRHHRRLTEAARTWLEHDHDPGTLYRGTRLARAEELFAGDDSLTVSERSFLLTALRTREAEEQAAARTVRRSRLLLSTLSAVLVVALITGLAAWQQHRDSERQRIDTAARRVASVSDSLRSTDPRTAMLLGLAAWRIAQLPETRRALLGSLNAPEGSSFTDPAPGASPARFLADSGRTLLSVDGLAWRSWDVSTGRRTGTGRVPDGEVVAAGPDARVLAVARDDGVRLWDTRAGRWTGIPEQASALVDFGASGHDYVVTDLDASRIQLRSVADGRVLFTTRFTGPTDVVPSADDQLVAVCANGKPLQVQRTDDHRILPGGWEGDRSGCGADHTALVLGRGRLANLSEGGVRVWDTSSGRRLADLNAPGVRYAAFSEDGGFLATADGREIRVWRLTDPDAPVFRHSLNDPQQDSELTWDSTLPVLRYREGGTVHSIDVAGAVTSAWRDQPLAATSLSTDGRTLATAVRDGSHYRFQLRDTRDGRVLRTLPSPSLPVSRDDTKPVVLQNTMPLLAFSPDSTALAYGVSAPNMETASQQLTVWDMPHSRTRARLDLSTPTSAAAVIAIALAPGGHTLYAARTPSGLEELSNETWAVDRHRRTGVLPGRAGQYLAVRPDGRLLAGEERAVSAGRAIAHGLVQDHVIGALAFAPDGTRLAAGDLTGRVALWDGSIRHRAGILPSVFPTPVGDVPETVSALAFSPDGRTLAVGGSAGTLQLWDAATQQPLGGPLATPGERVVTLAFSADSDTLYAGSAHVPLQRYTVGTTQAAAQICARVDGADLTRVQWHTYIPDVPRRSLCGE